MHLDRLPTVAEAIAAQDGTCLHESYWWMIGWNFNRPVIARIGAGGTKAGPYVWVEVGDNCPVGGYRADDRKDWLCQLVGPIPCPFMTLTTGLPIPSDYH